MDHQPVERPHPVPPGHKHSSDPRAPTHFNTAISMQNARISAHPDHPFSEQNPSLARLPQKPPLLLLLQDPPLLHCHPAGDLHVVGDRSNSPKIRARNRLYQACSVDAYVEVEVGCGVEALDGVAVNLFAGEEETRRRAESVCDHAILDSLLAHFHAAENDLVDHQA